MQEYEKLGAFYHGKEYELQSGKRTNNFVLYDSKKSNINVRLVALVWKQHFRN